MRPERIILVRHGEAEGNVDDTVFERKADHALILTERGVAQAEQAGQDLARILDRQPVQIYVSPYTRTRQTFDAMRPHLDVARAYEEPRLREQDWGNYQNGARVKLQRQERDRFGHFYYRFEHGESGADVYDRVSTFLETLHRAFLREDFPKTVIIVTHGLTMRLFLMRWFHWSVEYFESLSNPEHCEARILIRDADGQYSLDRAMPQWKPVALPRWT